MTYSLFDLDASPHIWEDQVFVSAHTSLWHSRCPRAKWELRPAPGVWRVGQS